MRFIIFLIVMASLLVATTAAAATKAPSARQSRGYTYTMCLADTINGVCDSAHDGSGTDVYIRADEFSQFTVFFSTAGGNGDATCEIYGGTQDLYDDVADGTTVTLAITDGTKLNSVSLSSTQTALSYEAPFFIMWMDCTADTGAGTHTVTIQASKP
jgi:hypothetical protein